MRYAQIRKTDISNGTGIRTSLFVQGCTRHIAGATILGGEPMEPENRRPVRELLRKLKERCPEKNIWMYSSYLFEEIMEFDPKVLQYLDVLVDGPFVEEKKDLNLRFRGSSNQRVIDVKASLESKTVILLEV